jgi:DNA polymerase alpha subunit A
LSTRTVVHLKENKREIVVAAGRVWHNSQYLFATISLTSFRLIARFAATVDIDDPTPIEKQGSSSQIFVRNLFTDFPKDFDRTAREATKNSISIFKDERPLLMQLLRTFLLSIRLSNFLH